MSYNEKILSGIEIINSVFEELKIPKLFDNKDFIIDEISNEIYLKFNLKKANSIGLSIMISLYDIQINIDRISEAYEWSDSQIKNSPSEIAQLIKLILTSRIQVQYCGYYYTKLFFFDSNGVCLKTLREINGIYLKINCKSSNYPAVYELI